MTPPRSRVLRGIPQNRCQVDPPHPNLQERLRLLTDTLRSIGIPPKVKQVRQGDGRVRVYRVEGAAQARQDGAHYLRGLLHPEPGDRAWSQVEEARVRAGEGADDIDMAGMFGADDSSR